MKTISIIKKNLFKHNITEKLYNQKKMILFSIKIKELFQFLKIMLYIMIIQNLFLCFLLKTNQCICLIR